MYSTPFGRPRIAYFSMEVAIADDIPTYSGGLGILAGDTLRSAADLRIPLVGVTLVSRKGYFRQQIDDAGRQVEHEDPWEPSEVARQMPAKVSVEIGGRPVWVGSWLYEIDGMAGMSIPVILLDTDLPENGPNERRITDFLYGGDEAYRLSQEIVLGIGGARMLEALGYEIDTYHLNEGHSAVLTLELLARSAYEDSDVRPGEPRYDVPLVREHCHFTTHTPVEAGHDRFSYDLVEKMLGDLVDFETLRHFAGRDEFNSTLLALNLSEYVNGVAKSHVETSKRLYPGYQVSAITNGIHPHTWAAPPLARLYDKYMPGWCLEPELLMRADAVIETDELWTSHMAAKEALIGHVRSACGIDFDPDVPLIGYARRMTPYKRPELFFQDIERLRDIAARQRFQVVFAGKAHPRDAEGKNAIEHLNRRIRELRDSIRMAFLPDYTMATARKLVSGCDIWLNTPKPPLEASGTSGMKAALNGVPNLSVLDGWWLEGHLEGVTGWSIGERDRQKEAGEASDAAALYRKLDETVLPLFADRQRWAAVMKGAIARNASLFHSHRTMRRYAAEAYLR